MVTHNRIPRDDDSNKRELSPAEKAELDRIVGEVDANVREEMERCEEVVQLVMAHARNCDWKPKDTIRAVSEALTCLVDTFVE